MAQEESFRIGDLREDPVAVELRRLQDENENLRNISDVISAQNDDCRRHALGLEKRCSELSLRPPIGAPVWRRLKYLVTKR